MNPKPLSNIPAVPRQALCEAPDRPSERRGRIVDHTVHGPRGGAQCVGRNRTYRCASIDLQHAAGLVCGCKFARHLSLHSLSGQLISHESDRMVRHAVVPTGKVGCRTIAFLAAIQITHQSTIATQLKSRSLLESNIPLVSFGVSSSSGKTTAGVHPS